MLLVMDEDVVVAVGAFLAERHEVRYVVDVLGAGTPDPDVVAYARSVGAILVTADRSLAAALRQRRRARCLYLRDLHAQELDRVIELEEVIASEHAKLGERFWMMIAAQSYQVLR